MPIPSLETTLSGRCPFPGEAADFHRSLLVAARLRGGADASGQASVADWPALRETLYLASIPGMAESIRDGLATPVDECSPGLDW